MLHRGGQISEEERTSKRAVAWRRPRREVEDMHRAAHKDREDVRSEPFVLLHVVGGVLQTTVSLRAIGGEQLFDEVLPQHHTMPRECETTYEICSA